MVYVESTTQNVSVWNPLSKMGSNTDFLFQLETIGRIAYIHDRAYKSVNFGEDLIKEMVFSSVCGVPLSVRSSMTAYRLMIQRVHRVATNFDPFGNLVSSKFSVIFLKFLYSKSKSTKRQTTCINLLNRQL